MGKVADKSRKIKNLRTKIENTSVSQATDIEKLFGLLRGKIKKDPVKLQRKWRNEDR